MIDPKKIVKFATAFFVSSQDLENYINMGEKFLDNMNAMYKIYGIDLEVYYTEYLANLRLACKRYKESEKDKDK